jgi:hypothetical protein
MNNIVSFEDFLLNENMKIVQKEFNSFLKKDGKRSLFEALSTSVFLTKEEREFSNFILESGDYQLFFDESLNEESIADKIKAKAQAAIQTAKQKGKQYLSDAQEMVIKMGGTISSLIQKIIATVKDFLSKAWEYIKSQVESGYAKSKEKIVKAASGKFAGKQSEAKEEVGNLGAMAKATAKWATGGVIDSMKGGMEQAGKIDESYISILENALYISFAELIKEDREVVQYIKEGGDHGDHGGGIKIPFISSLAHKLAEVQPFKSLHKIEHAAGDAANSGLSKISSILSSVAKAPGPFEFAVVGSIFALVTGYAIKAGVKSLVHEVGVSAVGMTIMAVLPGIGVILTCMKYAAKGIWVVGICETALSIAAKGEDHSEEKPEEKSEETPDKTEEEE